MSEKRNPVQIVLNANNYIAFQERSGGGGNRDFFAERDTEFAAHKTKLTVQLDSIREAVARSSNSAAFIKVKLRREAWAKSHRPTHKLFQPAIFPSAGVDGIGEIYYRVSAATLPKLLATIAEAEPETRHKFNEHTQKKEPHPTRARSEVGAIQEVLLPEAADRRSFSAKEALAWFEDGRSGKMYLLDLFNLPKSLGKLLDAPREDRALYEGLIESLNALDFGVVIFRSSLLMNAGHSYLLLRPVKRKQSLSIQSYFGIWDESFAGEVFDDSEAHHEQLLKLLSRHPLVRRIMLPPIVQGIQQASEGLTKKRQLPPKKDGVRYPRVGIVDAGISAGFSDWIIGRAGVIDASHRREEHGTFIAGLLVAARAAGNAELVAREPDGCELVDLDIFPNHLIAGAFASYYPYGFEDFLQEMDLAIAVAKQKHNVRIFNLSINIEQQVNETSYSPFAELMDAIAEKHDVVIVISAGNLKPGKFRGVWPATPDKVPGYLLPHAGTDRIFQPAESVFSISVGAVNPPHAAGHIADAPTPYTRCGPGMKVGVKPDVCHYGGTTRLDATTDECLYSLTGDGEVTSGMGTSYAAPFVAKTLASVESRIEGHVPRETLIALLVHRCKMPAVLEHPELGTIARNFVGFGMPASSEEILVNESNSITMLFNSVLTPGKELRFDFAWPKALVTVDGKCRGAAHLTLVYKPSIDASCGAEFVRVNLDAHLRQHKGDGHYEGRSKQLFMKGAKGDAHFESDLIEHGLKWWPIKHYRMDSPRGIGKSSEWRLVVEPLLRDGAEFPPAGVPFCAILTIFDPEGEAAIFDEMRLWLTANSVKCDDIRTAARIRARGSA